MIDNEKAGYAAAAHLISQGCRRIMHITGSLQRNVYADRLEGYRQALLEHGLPYEASLVVETDLSQEAGTQVVEMVQSLKPIPDGIFVANDFYAVTCMGCF